jgi:ribosome biogenesis protein
LLGSYNNSVQVWNTNEECIATLPGHNGPVKAVSWIANDDKNEATFLSASHDQTILIWNWNKSTNKVNKAEKCIGHTESVECVDVNMKNSKVN